MTVSVRAALIVGLLAAAGCAGVRVSTASASALRSLIQVVESQSSAESTVIAVCTDGRRVSGSLLETLRAASATTLVNCDRTYESRDGRYFDRSTQQRLWAVDLGEVRLAGNAGSAKGSVHCGFTCGGEHLITLAEKDGEWLVVERQPGTIF